MPTSSPSSALLHLAPRGFAKTLFGALLLSLAALTVSGTASAVTRAEAVARAQSWVDAGMPYCQVPYGGCDSHVCCGAGFRPENPAWDHYRSDCSGLVSYAWGLPPPGRVTHQFAPHTNDISHEIDAHDLKPGDALNKWDQHIVLFVAWVGTNRIRLTEEYNWGHDAHTVDTNVTINGSSITRHDWNETFTAIRWNDIEESCAAHCEGSVMVGTDCGKNDCGAFGASCADDSAGLRCVEPFCPVLGDAVVCIPGTQTLAHCHDGAVPQKQECGADGGVCSKKGSDHCDHPPRGYLDTVTCDTLGGWTQDPDSVDAALDVHVTFDGKRGDAGVIDVTLPASTHREDLCQAIGSCNHGYAMRAPRSLLDGNPHQIHVYVDDITGGPSAELSGSPKTLRCDPPALPPPPAMLRTITTTASFSAWKLQAFYDVAPMPGALDRVQPADVVIGQDFPSDPDVVRADDGTKEVWVLDGGTRRHVVDEASMAAWRLTSPRTLPALELYQMPHGADFPALPLVVAALGPTMLVLDLPFVPQSAVHGGESQGLGGSAGASTVSAAAGGASATAHGATISAPPPGLTMELPGATGGSEEGGCSLSSRGTPLSASSALLAALGIVLASARRSRRNGARPGPARWLAAPLVMLATACAGGSGTSDPADEDATSGGVACVSGCAGSGGVSGAGGASGGPSAAAPPGATTWSKSLSGSGDRYAVSVASDAAGNVVVLGFFAGTIDLGGGPLSSEGDWSGAEDAWAIFVAELDPMGHHLWSKRFSGPGAGYPQGVSIDAAGNVVLTGGFTGTLAFDDIELTSAGGKDVFVASLDATGKTTWAHRFGDDADQKSNAVAVDGSGDIVLVGDLAGVADFGGGPLTSAGQSDGFAVKLDATGKHLWSSRFGDDGAQTIDAVAVDAEGDVVLAGGFQGAIDFGGGALISAGGTDVFVGKLDKAGKHLWSHRYGDAKDQLARGVAIDASGNVALTGELSGVLDFGPVGPAPKGSGGASGSGGAAGKGGAGGSAPAAKLKSSGGMDMFLAALDHAGETLWARSFGDHDDQRGWSVVFDTEKNLVVTGDAPGALDLGSGPLADGHVVVASFASDGAPRWSNRYGPGAGQGLALATGYPQLPLLPTGGKGGSGGASGGSSGHAGAGGSGGAKASSIAPARIFFTGVFSDTVDFGAGAVQEQGHTGAFVGRLTP